MKRILLIPMVSISLKGMLLGGIINVPGDHSTIQAALNAAQTGDTVLVQPGTYYENIFWPDVNGIKLISAGDSSDTIIDGGGVSSVIYMNASAATVDSTTQIIGFRIRNGDNVQYGGGIFCQNASPMLRNLHITLNNANTRGSAVYISTNSSGYLIDCLIENNSGTVAIAILDNSDPTLQRVTVKDNAGAGIEIRSFSNPNLSNVDCMENEGIGIMIDLDSFPSISNSRTINNGLVGLAVANRSNPTIDSFESNYNSRGGIGVHTESSPQISNTIIEGNTVSGDNRSGAGLNITGGNPIITDVEIRNNSILGNNGNGGGVYVGTGGAQLTNIVIVGNSVTGINGKGGGLYTGRSQAASFNNVVIADNYASSEGGGLYHAQYGEDADFSQILITRNSANRGGGIFVSSAGFENITNITVTNNKSTDNSSSGIQSDNNFISLSNSNIAYNTWGFYNGNNSLTAALENNWWGHPSGPYHPTQNATGQGDSVNAFVNVTPWLTTPDTAAPPIPAQNLHSTGSGIDFINLSWDPSPLGDFAGFKLYYDSDSSGYPYSNSIDVGTATSYSLTGLEPGTSLYLAVTVLDTDGNESWYSNELAGTLSTLGTLDIYESSQIPIVFALHQNYPNPFNPATNLEINLPKQVDFSLKVYDIMGREVITIANELMNPGYHRMIWNGRDSGGRQVPSGIYIARLVTPQFTKSIKMVLLK